MCTPGLSATGICPGKCGTLPPTALTAAPTLQPPNTCGVHRQCATNAFCNSTRKCQFCSFCVEHSNRSLSTSVNGICPFKCRSILLQSVPTPPTNVPSAAPTQLPSSGAPVPAPVTPDCRNHNHCPITHFCARPTGRCLRCLNCTAGPIGNSINNNCPAKCAAAAPATSPTSNGCVKHFHCDRDSFCHTTAQCVKCRNFVIGGAAAANCTVSDSITGVCPTKCLQVLTPDAVGATPPDAASTVGSGSVAGAAIVGTLVIVAAVAGVALVRRRRRGGAFGTALQAADRPTTISAPSLDGMVWDDLINPSGLGNPHQS